MDYKNDALRSLEETPGSLVLGLVIDGGYYLIALDSPLKALFEGIEWSTPAVLGETLRRAEAVGVCVTLLQKWHDIDTPEDLERLKNNKAAPISSAFLEALEL